MMTDPIPQITEYLEKAMSSKTVFGEPQQLGDLTLIPVVDVTFGFGAGGGEGSQKENQGTGGGGGAGARVAAKAIIVVKDGQVNVIPVAKGGAVEKIIEALPGLLEKLPMGKGEKETKQEAPAAADAK